MATQTKYFSPGNPVTSAEPEKQATPAPKSKALKSKPSKPAGPSTQEKIERAALTLFAAGGVDGVSTRDLAATAGVSEGVIYRYFKSKDALARSLMVAGHKRLR